MLLTSLFEHRADKFKPSPDSFNYGQDRFSRTHTYDAHCTEPVIVGKVVSIQYSIHWYGARAAHPNQHFQTYSFLLEPLILIESLSDIFREPDVALVLIQALEGISYMSSGSEMALMMRPNSIRRRLMPVLKSGKTFHLSCFAPKE